MVRRTDLKMNSSFILTILPQDVVLHIFNEWLCSIRDFISFDRALTHKATRDDFFSLLLVPFQSTSTALPKNKYIQFDNTVPIRIRDSHHMEDMWEWEKKRGIHMRNAWVVENTYSSYSMKSGGCLVGVTTLKFSGPRINLFYNLFDVFGDHLPSLESLSICECRILISPEVLNESDGVVTPAITIKQLMLRNVVSIDLMEDIIESHSGKQSGKRSSTVPVSEYGKVFLKIAQYCPKLQNLIIHKCNGATSTNVIPMIRSLPELVKYTYVAPADYRHSNNDQSTIASVPLLPPSTLSSLILILADTLSSDHLEVMFACCDGQFLRHVDITIHYPSQHNHQILLDYIEHHWVNLRTLRLCGDRMISCVPLCLRVCQQLQELKLKSIMDDAVIINHHTTFAPLTIPNTLPNLHKLSFDRCSLTNEALTTLCTSTVAQQLTSLELCFCRCDPGGLQIYHMIAQFFPHLQHFCLQPFSKVLTVEGYYRDVVRLLDVLFGEDCAFASTIHNLQFKFFNFTAHNSSTPMNQMLMEELYHDHMVPHWTFIFPQLKSFTMEWKVNHDQMSQMIKQRLACGHHPHLHSISLITHNDEQNEHNLIVQNRPEVIRQLQEKMKENKENEEKC